MEAGRGDDGAAKTEEGKGLELAECEGLPREMAESVRGMRCRASRYSSQSAR